jgi:hypothetical protein
MAKITVPKTDGTGCTLKSYANSIMPDWSLDDWAQWPPDLYLDGREVPLIVLAHSLGGHIISNYIWDLQHGRSVARHELSRFERMNTLTRLITFGCNIPLFTFAYPDAKPIDFPSAEMPKYLQQKARWLNLHNPADLLGYPLSPISRDYEQSAVEDIQFRNGGFPLMWTSLAHIRYWKDRKFAGIVSKQIAELLEGQESPNSP